MDKVEITCPVHGLFRQRAHHHVSNRQTCPACAAERTTSLQEAEVLEFVKSIYDGTIVENDRTVIHPKELDIYIPDKRLAIEFDGLY